MVTGARPGFAGRRAGGWFDRDGFEGATVAAISHPGRGLRTAASSISSDRKRKLAGTLFSGKCCSAYHARNARGDRHFLEARGRASVCFDPRSSRLGGEQPARKARYLFEIFAQRMDRRSAGRAAGAEIRISPKASRPWCSPLIARGELFTDDADAVLQPDHWSGADILSRVAVGPRPLPIPGHQVDILIGLAPIRAAGSRREAAQRTGAIS